MDMKIALSLPLVLDLPTKLHAQFRDTNIVTSAIFIIILREMLYSNLHDKLHNV